MRERHLCGCLFSYVMPNTLYFPYYNQAGKMTSTNKKMIKDVSEGEEMKLVSWNVNGLRACVKKGFMDYFQRVDADIFCVQETKLQEGQIDLELEGYHQFWNYAIKKGYSGTAVFTKMKPLSVRYGVGADESEGEGRILTLEFNDFFLVNVYTPNSQRDLARISYRLDWEDRILQYLKELNELKPIILCGDLNVAHQEIDLRNPKSNLGNSGFTYEERDKMAALLSAGFVDSFRHFYPDKEGAYTWWSYMNKVRERNIGWRIDYFIVSETLIEKLMMADIHSDILGSDHCPVVLEIK
ncbi:exodeoxyribonuclease-3 [Bacillus sp. SORGH_AS 510]|nr:exodeoxyribonuclease-3 [Bacillus sp. SORGH_AS_0510]